MSSSGPIIEELPDDYDDSAGFSAAASGAASSSSAPLRETHAATATSSGVAAGLRKGFFNRPPDRLSPMKSSSDGIAAHVGASSSAEDSRTAASSAPEPSAGEAHLQAGLSERQIDTAQSLAGHEAEVSSLLDSLRVQISSAAASAMGGSQADEGEIQEMRELRELISSISSSQFRWPTSQARSALTKASLEANTALAEMRAASNDARRMRSGDEKKIMAEIRRVTDDTLERVRKVVDISAPKATSEEEKAHATVAAFHALPFTAKLRVLADERTAVALFGASFAVGVALVLGIMLEVYSAWGCGHRCGSN